MLSDTVLESASRLCGAADVGGTPAYVYDMDVVRQRMLVLRELFGRCFGVSYAVKANPNIELLRRLLPLMDTFDVSSLKEAERALEAGCPADRISFSGPAKQEREIRAAVALGVGELVLESLDEAEIAAAAAAELGVRQPVLLRINPIRVPRQFGVQMAGKPSQFGIDEEELEAAIDGLMTLPHLELVGFHIYSGTNSIRAEAIEENFGIFVDLFRRACGYADLRPRKLIFGSGFGLAYTEGETPLDVGAVADAVLPLIDALKAEPRFAQTTCLLEMGRWIVGPAGWLLTRVVREKLSRGVEFRMCDAGFNNHLAACGMMGTVIRRNWRFLNVTSPEVASGIVTLVGPLCTSIDVLASNLSLPAPRMGDVLAVCNSGAYGLTASPTRFISHPEPREMLLDGVDLIDVTESALNHWQLPPTTPEGVEQNLDAGR